MSHLIEHWQPEDKTFWQQTGKKIATRNLWVLPFKTRTPATLP